MPFDPTIPADNTLVLADALRGNFTGLKALIDAQGAQIAALTAQVAALQFGQTPVGGVLAWMKDKPGTPPLPANFVELNGQTLDDPESIYNGQVMEPVNANGHFLRGGLSSGNVGGSDTFATTTVDFSGIGTSVNVPTTDYSPGASPVPLHTTVVWVMRIK
jgi:hypothetical protein